MPTGFGWVDGLTDPEGRFEFSDLEPGRWAVMARRPDEPERDMRLVAGTYGMLLISVRDGGPEADLEVELQAGETVPVTLVLGVRPELGCRLHGRLTGPEPETLANVRVRWIWMGQDALDARPGGRVRPKMGPVEPYKVTMDEDGVFDFGVVRAGPCRVEALLGERQLPTVPPIGPLELEAGSQQRLDLELPTPRRIFLRVLSLVDGVPLTAGRLEWHDHGWPWETGRAELDGRDLDLALASGTWSFRLHAEGWGDDPRRVEIPAGHGPHRVDLIAEPSVEWEAILLDHFDRPLRGVKIVPYSRDGTNLMSSVPTAVTDDAGHFQFTTLPAAQYRAFVEQPYPGEARRIAEIDLDLTSESGETIVVRDSRRR